MPYLENDIWKVFGPKGLQLFGVDCNLEAIRNKVATLMQTEKS